MIAKPVDAPFLERTFYETLVHEDLAGFIPVYYGSQEVRFDEKHMESGLASAAADVSPWAKACFDREHQKLRVAGTSSKPCILLEDLTAPFSLPCIVDLKMGTRSHPDDVSVAKAERARLKYSHSTSSSHGVRICGLQRFDPVDGKYHYVDKYRGRDLKQDQLSEELHRFVDLEDASRALAVLDLWLDKLQRMEAVLRDKYAGYRFFSSSVLLLYEGAADEPVRADARLIDFAHTRVEPDAEDPDSSLLFGFHNLVELLSTVRERVTHGLHPPRAPSPAATSAAAAS